MDKYFAPFLIVEKYFIAYRRFALHEIDVGNVRVAKQRIQVNVRQAGFDDMEKLVEMRTSMQDFGKDRIEKRKYMMRVSERLKAGHWCFLAERTGEIVGYVWIAFRELYVVEVERRISLKEDGAMIYDVYTFPPCRGKGIAPKIYEKTLNHLRKSKYKKVYVLIAEHNMASRSVLKKISGKAVETITFLRFFSMSRLLRTRASGPTFNVSTKERD